MDIKGILNQSWSTWPRWFAWMSHLPMDVGRECHWRPQEPHTSPRALRFFYFLLFILDILSFKLRTIMAVFFGIIPFSILVHYDSSLATHCLQAAWKGTSSLVFFFPPWESFPPIQSLLQKWYSSRIRPERAYPSASEKKCPQNWGLSGISLYFDRWTLQGRPPGRAIRKWNRVSSPLNRAPTEHLRVISYSILCWYTGHWCRRGRNAPPQRIARRP